MDWLTITASILGGIGIGTIFTTFLDKLLEANLERQKILYDKKFEAYSNFVEYILGFNAAKNSLRRFEAYALSTKTRMLLQNDVLDNKIRTYIHEWHSLESRMDEMREEKDKKKKDELDKNCEKEFTRLKEEGREIVGSLRKDLKSTLPGNFFEGFIAWFKSKKP